MTIPKTPRAVIPGRRAAANPKSRKAKASLFHPREIPDRSASRTVRNDAVGADIPGQILAYFMPEATQALFRSAAPV
jgi:hypothetical protein